MRSTLVAVVALAALTRSVTGLFINGSVIAPCDSPLYCQGDILKALQLARPFSDSKTFIDMPTIKPIADVIEAFYKLPQPLSNNSVLHKFLATNFGPAGGELVEVPASQLKTGAKFVAGLNDTVVREFLGAVINIWPDLTRQYNGTADCSACSDSFVAVNRSFVVAGGRFREPYYWDSYWILLGLLRTGGSFTRVARNVVENFLDLVDRFGFVPNGARVYYLNRSQPPLLAQMVGEYMRYTNDTTILHRALPLLIREHDFWMVNRTVNIAGPDGQLFKLNRVQNTQPRPESYRDDWVTANNESYYAQSGVIYPEPEPLRTSAKEELYAELASGAESGWDYSSRWLALPNDAARDDYFPLRSLNIRNLVPVDLNSILYWNEMTIADLLEAAGRGGEAARFSQAARERSYAMHSLMWNNTLWSYFDFNLTTNTQNRYVPVDQGATDAEKGDAPDGYQVAFSVAQFYPFWTGAAPVWLKNDAPAVRRAFARVEALLHRHPGGVPATNFQTNQQWDEPNVWPPLQHVLMQGLLNTPTPSSEPGGDYATGYDAGTAHEHLQELALRIAQRYLDSAFCAWYATGGSTSLTPRLIGTTPGVNGIMFEKYADNATNSAGSGGEYTVVEGFGWSNGVLIWAADTFGNRLQRPSCGNIQAAVPNTNKTGSGGSGSKSDSDSDSDSDSGTLGSVFGSGSSSGKRRPQLAVELDPWDAQWIKKFGRIRS